MVTRKDLSQMFRQKPSERDQIQTQNSPKQNIITLLCIDDHLSCKINNAAQKSELNIKIERRCGKTLASTLAKSALEQSPCPITVSFYTLVVCLTLIRSALKQPCPRGSRKLCHTCDAGAVGKCHLKNVVIKLHARCAPPFIKGKHEDEYAQ